MKIESNESVLDTIEELCQEQSDNYALEDPLAFKCSECSYATRLKTNLNTHEDAIHRMIRHPCPECGKKFAQSSSMRLHLRSIHMGISYPCKFCDYSASTKGNLKYHQRKHSKGYCSKGE